MTASTEPALILVVDDQAANAALLARILAPRGHRVEIARDGPAALTFVEHTRPDLILLDVMMPGLDGFDVLHRLRNEYDASTLPVLMVTARSDSEDVVRAMAAGANDYIIKPIDPAAAVARVETQLRLARTHAELLAAHDRMALDLAAAAAIQRSLLPIRPPAIPYVATAWAVAPCAELAGDTLHVVPIGVDELSFFCIDVSGHGVPAALLSVTLHHVLADRPGNTMLFDADSGAPHPPGEVARRLNQHFPLDPHTEQFFTLLHGRVSSDGTFRWISAGHPAPYILEPGRSVVTDPAEAELPIGWSPGTIYPETIRMLGRGTRIIVVSDGISDARNPNGEPLGEARIHAALEASRDGVLQHAVDALIDVARNWVGSDPADDLTVFGLDLQ